MEQHVDDVEEDRGVTDREQRPPQQQRKGPEEPARAGAEPIGLRHCEERVVIGEQAEAERGTVQGQRGDEKHWKPLEAEWFKGAGRF